MADCLIFGDSNTYGTPPIQNLTEVLRHPKPDRWPSVLQSELGTDWDVIADGLPGRTTVHDDLVEGGARNGMAILPSSLHAHGPVEMLVIMLGTNDLKKRFSVTAYEIARSLGRLIAFAQASGMAKDILVLCPVNVQETGTLRDAYTGAEARQKGLADFIKDTCDNMGAYFWDANDVARVSSIDGVHLDVQAHEAIGKSVAQKIKMTRENDE